MNKVKFFVLFLLLFNALWGAQKEVNVIAKMTKQTLFELDKEGINTILLPYLKEKPRIKKLLILDTNTHEVFFHYKTEESEKNIQDSKEVKCLENRYKEVSDIVYDEEKIGEVILCQETFTSKLHLTQKEKHWLQTHPVIRVHNEVNWAPINFNKNAMATGYSIEYMNLLAKKIGIKVEYVTDEWNNLYNMAINKKIDVMLNIAKTKEREQYFLFTSSYLKNPMGIFARKKERFLRSLEDLNGKKVSVVDSFYHEKAIRENYPLIQVINTKNTTEALQMVCDKKVDATVGSFIVNNYLLNEIMCYDIEYKGELKNEKEIALHLGVRKDYPELHSILQKAMADVGSNEVNRLRKKWIPILSLNKKIFLTQEEKAWIKRHPIINIGGERDWAPLDFVDESGHYNGLANDYISLISKLSGIKFNIVIGKRWQDLLDSLKSGTLDMLPAIYFTKEREGKMFFTHPYLSIADYYFTKNNYPKINDIEELYGKKVASIKGYEVTSWLHNNHPQIDVIEYDTLLQSLRSVESGDTVAFINDNPSSTYAMEKNFITTLKLNNIVKSRTPVALHMAVKKEFKPLVSIINKVFDAISREDKKLISQKWMTEIEQGYGKIELTTEELIWLSTKPTIKFSVDPKWLPIEAIDQETKQYVGMMADYLDKIKELTGIRFELVSTDTWTDSVSLAKLKKIDMLAALSMTPERKRFLNFSDTTITLTDGVIMKSDAKFIASLEDLKGLKVGIPEGTSIHKKVQKDFPELTLIPIKGTYNGIEQLNKGNIDAFIGNLEVISHLIFTKNLLNLKVALNLDEVRELHIALLKNYPKEALSIINKAIHTISLQEYNVIRQRWIGLKINVNEDYTLYLKILSGVLVLFLFFAYHNRKLKIMVDKKTRDLKEQKKEVEELSRTLEKKVIERTQELDDERRYINSIMNSQDSMVITTDQESIRTANRAFLDFYGVETIEAFLTKYGNCVCDTFDQDESGMFVQKIYNKIPWVQYILQTPEKIHKTKITINGIKHIFSIGIDKFHHRDRELVVAVFTDITELEKAKRKLEETNKHVQSSIQYAALIQSSLIPDNELFRKYFRDYFMIWHPKDVVGGDIYLFEELRSDDECMLMVIDCTGHGVPGAFVTMLVKAIERQITARLNLNMNESVSPAKILQIFNTSMKHLLKQEESSSISNAGFDGQILYYNKKEKIVKCASAKNEIFYVQESVVKKIKGDRHSVGYKDSDINFEFTEHSIDVSIPTTLYISSDGYWDQLGGEKQRSFGKKRLQALLEEIKDEPLAEQQEEIIYTLAEYQGKLDRQDDVTFIGLKI